MAFMPKRRSLCSPATGPSTKPVPQPITGVRSPARSRGPFHLAARIASLPTWSLVLIGFAAVALGHWTLLTLPYFWDEGGYYIPAGLDFYHRWTLIPHFTNAHPPLPNVFLGLLWHVAGYHILATRLLVCAFAAAGLVAVFRMTQQLMDAGAALTVTALTAVYPIWFVQSTLAHADIFAAAFVLWGLVAYFRRGSPWLVALLFSLAVLSKETAIVYPAALTALELVLTRTRPPTSQERYRWVGALALPVVPLAGWYGFHRWRTGFTFGNPEYLRYNATANLTAQHVMTALRYRFLHLFWQRNIWLPIVLALACLLLPRRPRAAGRSIPPSALWTIFLLVSANWVAFSVLGGALLTRYLLPVYPLILIACVSVWRAHTRWWPAFAAVTAAAFLAALWINPPTSFAPEDALTYRDMIVVHQDAIAYVAEHYPDATVLTAWPVAADLFRPELGYVRQPIKAVSIEDFTRPEIVKAAAEPDRFDTAIVFTTHFVAPSFRHWLLEHPGTAQGREFAQTRDLAPAEIAQMLGGQIVWQEDRNGEWAAVLRFNRSYEAELR